MTRADAAKRRARARGAALVEAALVVPTLAILLGLTMYEYRSYREKMRAQYTARANALYYASHGCDGDDANTMWGSVSSAGGQDPAAYALDTGDTNGYASVTDKGPPGGAGQTLSRSRSFNQAHMEAKGEATGGHLSRQVKGESWLYCNEKPVDGDPVGVMRWGFGFIKSGLL